jgi:hypothetical protein
MNSKELRGLYEAYSEVYAPQQIDEAGKNDARIRSNIARFSGKKGVEYTPPSNWSQSENRGKGATISPKQTEKRRRKALAKSAMGEEIDIFDVVLEFLQAEGYAETLEEAEWMMANVIDEEAIDIILGEAQAARENPEKYEREASKTQPRGEQLKRKLDDKRKTNKSLDDMMKAYGF